MTPTKNTQPTELTVAGRPLEDAAPTGLIIHCLLGREEDIRGGPWVTAEYVHFFAQGVALLTIDTNTPDIRAALRDLAERFAITIDATPTAAVEMLASSVYRSVSRAIADLTEPPKERTRMLRHLDDVLAVVTNDIDELVPA